MTARKNPAAPVVSFTATELALLNNALNQALELPEGEFHTLIGASRKSGERLLARLGLALAGPGPKAARKAEKPVKKA